jgi:hypothetical protein
VVAITFRSLYPREISLILIGVAAVWVLGFGLDYLKMRIYPVSTGIRIQPATAHNLVTMQSVLPGPRSREVG